MQGRTADLVQVGGKAVALSQENFSFRVGDDTGHGNDGGDSRHATLRREPMRRKGPTVSDTWIGKEEGRFGLPRGGD